MARLTNHTSCAVAMFSALDQHARRYDVVVLSAAFEAPPGRQLRLADEQPAVCDADHYFGEPGRSSVRYEGETAWSKPYVDVLVNGRAFAPAGRKVGRVGVRLRVGDVSKELLITGNRHWQRGVLGLTPSSPEPFDTLPVVYERAFGGVDTRSPEPSGQRAERRNLVGVGLQGAPPQRPEIGTEVPNVEYPTRRVTSPSDTPPPAGFGVVGRDWLPRLPFGGTFDEEWLHHQSPLLPLDFDLRHFQTAPADQQSRTIRGGEPVEILNMTPEGRWQFALPQLDVAVRLAYRDRKIVTGIMLDTVLIEPDLYRVVLIARVAIPMVRNRAFLEEVIVGRVLSGWWRARVRDKEYLDHAGTGGRVSGATDFIT